jgi:hypothetical protein
MNKKLTNYFNWVNHFIEKDSRYVLFDDDDFDVEAQLKYLKEAFSTLESVNWNIEAAGIVMRANDRQRFPYFLEDEDDVLMRYLREGLGKEKEPNDDQKVTHFLRCLSRYLDRHIYMDDKEFPSNQLNFQSAVNGYLYWKTHDYKDESEVTGFLYE